jgi:hypothetical protein
MTTLVPKVKQSAATAVNRSSSDKLNELITPQDFGAVGDGTTNDTTAWTNFLAATGNRYIPAGDYLISAVVNKYTNGTFINKYLNNYIAGAGAGISLASSNLDADRGNVIIGKDAGAAITSGYRNVVIGAEAHKAGNGFHNVAIGSQTLKAATTASYNVIIGSDSGTTITTGGDNTVVGAEAFTTNTTGQGNTAMGISAMFINSTGNFNTGIGFEALQQNTTGIGNTALGKWAGQTANDGSYNTYIGFQAGARAGFSGVGSTPIAITVVGYNAGLNAWDGSKYVTAVGYEALGGGTVASGFEYGVAVGYRALRLASGSFNVAVGNSALVACTTGNTNTALGDNALSALTTGANCTGLGYNSAVTGDNQVQLGNASTTTYAYGAVQNRSDKRDKADIKDTALGLNFISKLRPVDFKWDYREDYDWGKKDGSKTRSRYHHGLIAQEVKSTLDEIGVDFGGYQDHSINGGKDVLSLGYEELIGPMIKAIQELKAEIELLKAK